MSRQWTYLLWIMALIGYSCPVAGQDFPSLHFTVEDGLPSNTVYQAYRDSKGYLWIATDKGIARYNGVKFEKFTTFDGLSDNEVFSFQEDYYGRLWFATYNGSLCYYQDGRFHTEVNTPFLKLPFKTSFIQYIMLNKDSSITVNYYDYSILLTIYKDRMVQHIYKDVERETAIPYAFVTRKISAGEYEVTGNVADVIMDTDYHIKIIRDRQGAPITKFTMSQNSNYFISRNFVFSIGKEIIAPLKKGFYDENYIHVYYTDGVTGFLCTTNGLFINDSVRVLGECNITTMTQDKLGNYWIGTLNDGIYSIKKYFINTRIVKNAYPGLVKYCYSDSAHLFFSVSNNNLYGFEHGKIKCLLDYQAFKRKNNSTPNDAGYLIEKNGNDYDYYDYYNEDNIVIKNVLSDNRKVLRYDNVFFSYGPKGVFFADNYLYIKGRDRIARIDDPIPAGGNKINEIYAPNTAAGYRIFGMAVTPDTSVIYSTINKVYKIKKGINTEQTQFNNLAFKTIGIFDKYLLGITFDNKLILCNSYDSGISIDSISGQDCIWQKLYRLNAEQVLVSTNNLYRVITLYPSAGKPRYDMLTVENPFIPLNVEAICADGTNCYFFKNGSITSLGIQSLLVNASPPELAFTMLKTFRRVYPIDSVIAIPFNESKNIIVSFSTQSFSGKNVAYQYSVSKNDADNWRDLNGEEINLFNSGYGNYVIKIKAKTISSGYSKPVVFTLHILAPFWTTWWFTAIVISSILALLLFVNSIRVKIALRRNEKEHETEIRFMRSEYKAMNALMNPHFIFNTLNNVQGLVNRNDKLAANEYLRVFADLVRQNMSNISKELIPLQKEIDLVSNYLLLEKLRFKELLNYNIYVDGRVDLSDIMVSPLLVQPLVENSIKHGILPLESPDGFIYVNIYQRDDRLFIEVKDNGVGMARSQNKAGTEHESFGLENIKTRIEQLSLLQNKKITFDIGEEKDSAGKLLWTIVTISMPLQE
jgi:two-component sensor histidine kinase